MMFMVTKDNQSGFALLITLIVVGVVISIGLAILDLSIKQVRLSSNAKESEVAFHAANAGAECARYWRRIASSTMQLGQAINPSCFGVAPDTNTVTQVISESDGAVYQYEYEFTWGTDTSCTQINTLVSSSSVLGDGVTTTNMTTLIPGYRGASDFYCEAGAHCTTISIRGYNQPCSIVGGYGVVQREVLLQF